MVGFPEHTAASFDDNVLKIKGLWEVPSSLKKVNWEGLEINEYFSFYRINFQPFDESGRSAHNCGFIGR